MHAHEHTNPRARRARPALLALLALPLAIACPPSNTGGGDGENGGATFVIGETIDVATCEDDVGCPPGYACKSGECRQIDNDIDNDGYDSSVDCDDNDPNINPGMPEICDGIDNNCNGAVDEGVLNACGYCGPVPVEICDGIDNDCDGLIDEDCVAGSTEEVEPNDGDLNCQHIALPPNEGDTNVISGVLNPAGDIDSYCFFVRPGMHLIFDLDSQVLGAPSDGVLKLHGPDGVPLPGGHNDYDGGPDPRLDFTFTFQGNVRLDVYNFDAEQGGPSYIYDLNITAVSLVECLDEDGDGVSTCDGDCNDADPLIFPNQTEVCDGIDNNCDGVIDEGCPDHTRVEREPNNSLQECEILMPPFTIKGVINPSRDTDYFCFFAAQSMKMGFDIDARETSNSLLNSRLELYDLMSPASPRASNNDGQDPETGYTAPSSDSYLEYTFPRPGTYAIRVRDVSSVAGGTRLTYTLHAKVLHSPPCTDNDGDGVTTCEGDCDDNDPTVYFGAIELCDGKDNNCDGVLDPPGCNDDFDGDGYTPAQGDCDDNNPAVHPGAIEVCDGIDNNCDGRIDEGLLNACGTCGFPPPEICGDGIDNDCDGEIDEDDCAIDADGDGYTPNDGDCDDTDPNVHPGAVEVCDGIDNNCNGLVDEYVKNSCGFCGPDPEEICDGLDNNCNGLIDDGVLNACGYCGPTPEEVCDGIDNNCDGQIDEGLLNACGECGPVPLEICDGIDNNCDGVIDEGCDVDMDGDGVTPRQGDCDDSDPSVHHGAAEICGDGKDNDCNGIIDDGCPVRVETEPNNTRQTCNTLYLPGQINGVIANTADVDFYCIDVPVDGATVGFNIDARPLGSSLDSIIRLYDAAGTQLALNNNGARPGHETLTEDSYLDYEFETAGRYVLEVGAQAIAPGGNPAFYELHTHPVAGCFDFDRDGFTSCDGDCDDFRAATHPGALDVCDATLIDDNCDGVPNERCWGECLDDVYKGNVAFPAAATIAAGNYPDLYLCGNEGANDFYRLPLTTGQVVTVNIFFTHAEIDLTLIAYSPQGQELVRSETSNNNETVQFNVTADGTYFFEVQAPFAAVGPYSMQVAVSGGTP